MLVNGVAPVIAPALGGLILSFTGWRMVFIILTIFGLLMFIGTLFKVPESLKMNTVLIATLAQCLRTLKIYLLHQDLYYLC